MKASNSLASKVLMAVESDECSVARMLEQVVFECMEKICLSVNGLPFFWWCGKYFFQANLRNGVTADTR
jgi:hypothetical protein